MSDSRSSRDIVIFLGAGFSKEAGMPTMCEFGEASKNEFEALKGYIHRRHAAPMLLDAAETFRAFQDFCSKSETLSKEDIDNLETVFCIAEAMREASVPDVVIKGRSYKMDEVIRDMPIWTWKIYQQYPTRRRATPPPGLDAFFGVLKDSGIRDRVTIVTTNYDLVFEYEAHRAGVVCAYPPLACAQESDAGNDAQSRFCSIGYSDNSSVPLFKLHGSVNYFWDSGNSGGGKLFVFTDLVGKKPVGRIRLPPNRPAIRAVDAIWNIAKKYGKGITPAIIAPTYAKLTGQLWLRAIWNGAFQALANATKIVFIGYSMPDTDGFMRALIHAAMARRTSGSPARIHVIDPCCRVRDRYKRLFPKCVCHAKKVADLKEKELSDILDN